MPITRQLYSSVPKAMKNVTAIAMVMKNSAKLIVPITLRGSSFSVKMSPGVAIGPQPPPPTASRKDATKPRPTIFREENLGLDKKIDNFEEGARLGTNL